MALHIKLADIEWNTVQDVQIDGRQIQILTDEGSFDFHFANIDELSKGLLILALKGTQQVHFVDDARFNPARLSRS